LTTACPFQPIVRRAINNFNNNNNNINNNNKIMETGAEASITATNKTNKYSQLSATHIFTPVAIETAGTWHHQAVELVQALGRRATIITSDSRQTTYLFQQLYVALQKGNAVSFQNRFTAS